MTPPGCFNHYPLEPPDHSTVIRCPDIFWCPRLGCEPDAPSTTPILYKAYECNIRISTSVPLPCSNSGRTICSETPGFTSRVSFLP